MTGAANGSLAKMASGSPRTAHPPAGAAETGVLLVNLGTPNAPTAHAVRCYLAEFLSDVRVVDYPRWLWLPLLHGVILNVRPARSARAYARIWTGQGSPLRFHTKNTATALGARLAVRRVDFAMRYGAPSVRERIMTLKEAGCARILAVPMYPQYSPSTVGGVEDAVAAARAATGAPEIRIAAPFFEEPLYVAALKRAAEQCFAAQGWTPERVILSFHGAPERWRAQGDPYAAHCEETARRIRAAMGWSEEFAPLAYQSKFGPEKWLSPATDATIRHLAAKGVRRLAVMTPGFMADCLETLEEIAIGGAEAFHEAGGEKFAAVPCLNDSPHAIDLLEALVARVTAGWI